MWQVKQLTKEQRLKVARTVIAVATEDEEAMLSIARASYLRTQNNDPKATTTVCLLPVCYPPPTSTSTTPNRSRSKQHHTIYRYAPPPPPLLPHSALRRWCSTYG